MARDGAEMWAALGAILIPLSLIVIYGVFTGIYVYKYENTYVFV